jgi:hypothetical protein
MRLEFVPFEKSLVGTKLKYDMGKYKKYNTVQPSGSYVTNLGNFCWCFNFPFFSVALKPSLFKDLW